MFPRDITEVRRLCAMRRHVHRYGFRLVVARVPAFVGTFRASLFDPAGEYCGGMNAPDLPTLVDGLGELLQPDGPLLYWPGGITSEMSETFRALRDRFRFLNAGFVVGWARAGCAPALFADITQGGALVRRVTAANVWALAEALETWCDAVRRLQDENPDLFPS